MENTFALGHVTSVPKEQNLPMLFNEGENSQVTDSFLNPVEVCMRLHLKLLLVNSMKKLMIFDLVHGLLVLCSCDPLF